LTQAGRFGAGLLAGGAKAVLFARSAAALHGVRPDGRADFHWPNLRLVVEIDGPDHDTAFQRAKDRARDELLEEHGWRVLRFRGTDLRDRPAWVLAQTRRAVVQAASIAA
jgi:hypothetical protein